MHPHFENVAHRHGAMGEAVDEQRLQDSLPIVEGVTHTGYTVENRHKFSLFLRDINQMLLNLIPKIHLWFSMVDQ